MHGMASGFSPAHGRGRAPQDAQQVMQNISTPPRSTSVRTSSRRMRIIRGPSNRRDSSSTPPSGSFPSDPCQNIFLQGCESQVRRRGLDVAPKICRQHWLIVMHSGKNQRRTAPDDRGGGRPAGGREGSRIDRRGRPAVLVIAEIIVLFSGVSARYHFQRPLIWSDELAGILFCGSQCSEP